MTGRSSRPVPIAVFGHARPALLERTLHALTRCAGFDGTRVHVFCDAAAQESRLPGVEATRRVAAAWCREHRARLVRRPVNRGMGNLTDGISELCAEAGAAISVEDDHLLAPGALGLLDRALRRYEHDDAVLQVSAYRPGGPLPALPDTFFLPLPMPIGWGTWSRAWDRFSWECPAAPALLASDERRRAFDLDGAYPASALLAKALAGTFHSYFIRWYCAFFTAGGLALCPRHSLVRNAGLETGLHGHAYSARRDTFHNGAWHPAAPAHHWAWPAATTADPAAVALVRGELHSYANWPG